MISKNSQMTVITIRRDEPNVRIFTNDLAMIRKFNQLSATSDAYQVLRITLEDGEIVECNYLLTDKELLKFRQKRGQHSLSAEQRKEIGERLTASRRRKKNE